MDRPLVFVSSLLLLTLVLPHVESSCRSSIKGAFRLTSLQDREYKFRHWKSANGDYTVYAQLVRLKDGKAKLRLDTGKIVNVPVEKLSLFDREYLETVESIADNPFSNAKPGDVDIGSGSAQVLGAKQLIRSLNSAQTKLVAGEWSVDADPTPGNAPAESEKVISLPKDLDSGGLSRIADVSVGQDGRVMAVVRHNSFDEVTELTAVDLVSGKSNVPFKLTELNRPTVAVSPSGKYAAVFRQGTGRETGRIDFVQMGSSPELVATWHMSSFFQRDGDPFMPGGGVFLSDDRLLTIDRSFVGVWDWRRGEAIYAFEIKVRSGIALSPARKQIAVVTKSGSVAILNSEAGKVLGVLNGVEELGNLSGVNQADLMAFSPNGQFLAGIDSKRSSIWICDLNENKVTRRFGAPTEQLSFRWIGNEYLLANDSELVDISLGATVWKFTKKGPGKLVASVDDRFWLVTNGQAIPINLLRPQVKAKLDQLRASELNPEDLQLLKPGTRISVDLDVGFDESKTLEIRNAVVQQLESHKLVIRDDADFKLSLKVVAGKEKEIEVLSMFRPQRFSGRPGSPGSMRGFPKIEPEKKVISRPKTCSITLTQGDRTIWNKSKEFGYRYHLDLGEGESAQQAIDRQCTPNPEFFMNWKLPNNHSQLPSGQPLGSSIISEEGIH